MLRAYFLLLYFLFLTLIAACNNTQKDAVKSAGDVLFPFDYKEVAHFQWVVNDPKKDIRFNITFEKDQENKIYSRKDQWLISSFEPGDPLKDRFANSIVINKLLDYFSTLKVSEMLKDRTPENYGLKYFHYAFRWSTPQFDFELLLGDTHGKSLNRYAQFQILPKDKNYKQKWDAHAIYLVEGAALAYLDQSFNNLSDLRLTQLLPIPISDITHIIYKKKNQFIFSAEREGPQWKITEGTPPKEGPTVWIESILKKQVIEFYELGTKKNSPKFKYKTILEHSFEFTSRQNKKENLKWSEIQNGYFIAETSLRPSVHLILHDPNLKPPL